MPWFKVDDGFHAHPKAIAAGTAALGLWVRCGSWSAQQLTDGFVPTAVASLYGTRSCARALVAAGLWAEADGGYQFHDWADKNPLREAVEASREAKRSAGRAGGKASGKVRARDNQEPSTAEAKSKQSASPFGSALANTRPDPTRPVPEGSEEPSLVEPTPLRKTRSSKTPARPCPDKIEISEGMRVWAAENAPGVRLVVETAKLVNWAHGKGERKADWIAAWRNWMLRRQEELDEQQRNRPALVSGDEEWMR